MSLILCACALAAHSAPARSAAPLVLDRGGFSVEFRGAGHTPVDTEELLSNGDMEQTDAGGRPAGWEIGSYVWLPVDNPAAQARMAQRTEPLMVRDGSTIEQACAKLHRDLAQNLKYALVWGPSAKFPGQRVSKDHHLRDGNTFYVRLK